MADKKFPLVEQEWSRLLRRFNRQGVESTCDHLQKLIQDGRYPLALLTRAVDYLLTHDEYECAGRIIKEVDRSGAKHPLMDKLHSTWLWCSGERRAALSFAVRSARRWRKSYLVDHAGTLYRCMADRENSKYYRRQSDRYWRLAHQLAQQELGKTD